jgi:hypothetical protein
MPRSPVESRILQELEDDLTGELLQLQAATLRQAARVLGRSSMGLPSLHGIIGGKNNEYTDAVRLEFRNPNDFIARWLRGLCHRAEAAARFGNENSATRIARLLKKRTVREYTLKFLTRNFYRNIVERTRLKPKENLWGLWFGDNTMSWGLLIAPDLRDGEWTNDKSEMRRADYDYWTVGHVLSTGILDPDSNELVEFESLSALTQFSRSVLRRRSASNYEKELANRYIEYLQHSDDVQAEPFLIPELRYAAKEGEHLYRLDFTIMNPHTMSLVGFEISPASTHNAVLKIKTRTQKDVNSELARKWGREMDKRNRYFSDYGISTVTFTGDDVTDLDSCFTQMQAYLSERGEEDASLEEQLEKLDALDV